MSKTIASILTVAAIVAIQFIPGVGQAIGGAIAGTIGIGTTTAATAIAIAQIAVVATGALLQALLPSQSIKPTLTETAIKSPTPARVSRYGEGRHHMAFALYVTDKNGNAIDAGVFHDGQVDAITGHYLGDTKVSLTSGGWVMPGEAHQFGDGSDVVQVGTRLGLATETAFSQIVALVPDQWTTDHRGDGCVTGFVMSKPVVSKYYQDAYPTGGPNNMPLSLVMRGQLVFDWRDSSQSATDRSTWRYSDNFILALAHYLLVRDSKDWTTHFVPTLAFWTAAANDADIAMPLKGVQAVLTAATAPDADHTLYLSTVSGLSAGMTITIGVAGDTSLTETRTVQSISGNIVTLSVEVSYSHPLGSQVTWASSTGAPATEPRYRTVVAHAHTDPHKEVIASLLACGDGWMAPRADGALVVYSGRYYAPTVTLGPDQIVAYSLQDGIEEESALNQLAVTYVSANHAYAVVDTDVWENSDDIAARGKVLADSLANQVPSHSQARRLAKRKMAQVSAAKRGSVTTTAAGRIALGQRYIRLQLIDAGTTFLDDVVEIVAPVKRNLQTGGISFSWILADSNVDAWNPATEEGDPAPVGNRVAATPLDTPTITSATPDFSAVADSGTGVRITIVAAGLNRADVSWFARWRVVGSPTWNEQQYTDIDPSASVTLQTDFVPARASVEVEVAYGTGDGRISPYSTPTAVDTSTELTVPDAASPMSRDTTSS